MTNKKIELLIKRALVTAENSPDEETQVGSVLVSKSTGSVISEGYNGFVRGTDDNALPRTRPAKYDFVIHAEQNLIYNAARNGVRTDSCFLVSTHSPCVNCARAIYQSGIDTVYFKNYYPGSDKIKELGDLVLEYEHFESFTKITIKPNKASEQV